MKTALQNFFGNRLSEEDASFISESGNLRLSLARNAVLGLKTPNPNDMNVGQRSNFSRTKNNILLSMEELGFDGISAEEFSGFAIKYYGENPEILAKDLSHKKSKEEPKMKKFQTETPKAILKGDRFPNLYASYNGFFWDGGSSGNDGDILAILGEKALVEYFLPKGESKLRIIDLSKVGDFSEVNSPDFKSYKNYKYFDLPEEWLEEMLATGSYWNGSRTGKGGEESKVYPSVKAMSIFKKTKTKSGPDKSHILIELFGDGKKKEETSYGILKYEAISEDGTPINPFYMETSSKGKRKYVSFNLSQKFILLNRIPEGELKSIENS